MYRRTITALAALVLSAAHADGQEPAAPGTLPPEVAAYVRDFYNAPATLRHDGRTRIAEDETVRGDVAVADGPLIVAGHIEGDVVVINGDAELLPGAAITGALTIVGGEVTGADAAHVGGGVRVHEEGLSYRRRDDRIVWVEGLGDDPAAPPATRRARRRPLERDVGGSATFVLNIEDTFNRTEGLAVRVGPTIRLGRSSPLVLHGHAILRTEGERPYGARRIGWDAGAEQSLGPRRDLRVGGRYYSLVQDVEGWQVSDLETSLSTMILGRDLRDQYEREGWSAYARLAPRDAPLQGGVEFRSETHRATAAGSPWTFFGGGDPWRPQPLVAEGTLQSLVGTAALDTRRPRSDPSTGWYAAAEVEHAVRSTLTRPGAYVYDPATGGVVATLDPLPYGTFTHGFVDVRRYNRLGPDARLNLRAVAGGSLDGAPLPPQRQHALGGVGTLPGFSLFSMDCRARSGVVHRPLTSGWEQDGVPFHPTYGCDAFALVQAEYRGDLRFRFRIGRDDRDDDDVEWVRERGRWRRSDTDLTWVLFADAARAWSFADDSAHDAVDVGAGVMIDGFGIYGAVPLSTRGGLRVFVRLQPRF
jgi:hypothetical protein